MLSQWSCRVHPQILPDQVWGRRAEGDITLESNFRAAPPVADFMDQPPWSLGRDDGMTIPEDMMAV